MPDSTTLPAGAPATAPAPSPAPSPAEEPATLSDLIDRRLHAQAARFTGGLSPAALVGACLDWAAHLALSPGKRLELLQRAFGQAMRLSDYAVGAALRGSEQPPCIQPLPQDRRFDDPAWRNWPFSLFHQSFLLQQQWWHGATTGVRGVTAQHERVVDFTVRQLLDIWAPSNFLPTNPVVLRQTVESAGANLVAGANNLAEDLRRQATGQPPVGAEAFAVGGNLAVTPGKVVFRNRLIELIQYEATTPTVRPEPILIVPAWIMKYYILDLSPGNSLVRYLTGQGFTVFMVSWKNPDRDDRDLGMEDYRQLGIEAAVATVADILPDREIHAVGYCLGGTLLSIAAAARARDKAKPSFASITLLAAQVDFTEAGELSLFINESQLAFLEDMMWQQGYLKAEQMAGAFQMLRSNDLVWSRVVHDYLMGQRRPMNDLMAWNADATRMPYRMHAEYLRKLFLDNDLAAGRYRVGGRPVAVTDIRAPLFAVGTLWDHVAPWRSAHKIHLLSDTEVTFLLTSGGHNAGIVSEPGHPGRGYQVMTKAADAPYSDPEHWQQTAPRFEGSWWPEWARWLERHSGAPVPPPKLGGDGYPPLCDAPGTYVLAT